ncbi:hypothetical protein [Paraburkholderia fungorum]|uniref:hypothetical protein n=1 Tax=Paraburkholderia fungorum TaxID=134537 RepID=UPI0038BB8A60
MNPALGKRKGAVCPPMGAPMWYRDRVVRVVAEASGQHAVIESIDVNARSFRNVVKWISLAVLDQARAAQREEHLRQRETAGLWPAARLSASIVARGRCASHGSVQPGAGAPA